MSKPIVLTGLRANSELHIGNYLGGILPIIELQNKHAGDYQINMFVPDLHSFTTPIDHSKLYQQTLDNLRVFVAAGLDIKNPDTSIYRQSFVRAHSELAWILSCFTGFGELSRMTQFKEKSHKSSETANASTDTVSSGLFSYPVLMAADILLYDASFIPVGDDQNQHIELARDLAQRMNNKFGEELFTVPQPWAKQLEFMNLDAGARIRSLRNPDKKMSKSISDPSGTIMLSDIPAEAAKKVMRAETDSLASVNFDFEKQPGISNLLQMLSLLTNRSQQDINTEWVGNTRYGDLKKAVANAVESFLQQIQSGLLSVNDEEMLDVLTRNEAIMNKVANAKLLRVQQAIGLRQ